MRGRPPAVRWPITRLEVCQGFTFVRTVHENTTVRCVRCGQPFLINRDTAFRYPGPDDMPRTRCPHCGMIAPVDDYYSQIKMKRGGRPYDL